MNRFIILSLSLICIVGNNVYTMEENNNNINFESNLDIYNNESKEFKKWSYDKLEEWLLITDNSQSDNSQNDILEEYRNYIRELLNNHTSGMNSMTGSFMYNATKKIKQCLRIGTTYSFTEIKKFFETESNKQVIDNILIDNIKEYIQKWSYQILVELLLNKYEGKQNIVITENLDYIKTNMFNLLDNPNQFSRQKFSNIYKQYVSDYLNGITTLTDNLILKISKIKQFFNNNNYKNAINQILSQNVDKFLANYIDKDETYTKILEYYAGKNLQLPKTIKTKILTNFEELSLDVLKKCILNKWYYNNDEKISTDLNNKISKYILFSEDYTKVSDELINTYTEYLYSYSKGNFSSHMYGGLLSTENKIKKQNKIKAVLNNVDSQEIKHILRRNIFSLKSNGEIVNYIKAK